MMPGYMKHLAIQMMFVRLSAGQPQPTTATNSGKITESLIVD